MGVRYILIIKQIRATSYFIFIGDKVKKNIVLLIALIFIMGCVSPEIEKYTMEDIEKLNQHADELDKISNVSAWKYSDTYMELGKAYYQIEEFELSLAALKKGLRLNSRQYDNQLVAAKVEYELEMYKASYLRVQQITSNCDIKEITKEALKLLKELKKHEFDKGENEIPNIRNKYIYILKVGMVEDIYIQALVNKLEEEFKISVRIIETPIEPSIENLRDNHKKYFNSIKERFIASKSQQLYEEIIQNLNLNLVDLSQDIITREFVHYLYMQEDDGEGLWTKNIAKIEDQYDADVIFKQINRDFKDKIREVDCFGILAVSSYDIYANDYNFLFGWNGSDIAVMSFNRFINGDTELTTEIKRIVMQGMSSTGYLIGIPRCTVDTCARAYPHSLMEHDKKNDTLCNECTENLINIYNDL